MKKHRKSDFPLDGIRRYLEPGPVVLVTSSWENERNIMVMGWHMMLDFVPARLACYIWSGNRSHCLIRNSRECVINLPTADMVDTVVGIGNTSAADGVDKFERFGLTPRKATHVGAPLIDECVASFECKLADDSLVERLGLFVWEVVKAHVAPTPKRPRTLHYRGDGEFMVAGPHISRKRWFLQQNL
ncbi:flavin reductase family protein [Vulcaniibacterium tengchongense]|uniref:Flavin reductase (DIM6/NTAB) family NADH-FMN oxidoreductase RutF n=1 Tax=Vulcaniibacterium tengchongense TaxID=1273429 RepID=A0A3N4VPS7_9GAMM|nr:flavin reductase family protein [Vulcaniibacterium tengchongense]RPE75800.1 flavin reductase (DIM6/NTAB) family NADH-FMN oxidoreductase RutF [Vulcaniibacterium tengchongense]